MLCPATRCNTQCVICTESELPTGWEWLRRPDRASFGATPNVNWSEACASILAATNNQALRPAYSGPEKRGAWPPQIWAKPDPVKPEFEIWGYLEGSTIGPSVVEASQLAPSAIGVCTRAFKSHSDAANALCNGEIYRYFGDIDLVRAAIETHRSKSNKDCPVDEDAASRGTYEPYAMVLSNRQTGFPEDFVWALYSMFTDGTMAHMFDGRFGERRRSQYLETLFRINSIPSGVVPETELEKAE